MLSVEPAPTAYDLHFSVFGVPVRVHPLFFLLPILWGADRGNPLSVLIFIVVFFVSILVHELGHSVTMLAMGRRSRIVLHLMGGVAIPEGYGGGRLSTRDEVTIYAAGPIAGFLLALLLIGVVKLLNGQIYTGVVYGFLPVIYPIFIGSMIESNYYLGELLVIGILINVYLNLFNLLPVIPLDGGQIMREIWVQADPWNGLRGALWTSVIVGVGLSLLGFSIRETFMGIFFAFLALNNFQTLQMGGPGGFRGGRPW